VGYTTDLIGHIAIDPPLNDAEVDYLTAFAETRRWFRPAGRYVVLDHPMLKESYDDIDLFNRPWPGEPSLNCDWVPSCGGQCITFNGNEKFYQPGPWLRYLIDHFLKPGAKASDTEDPAFDGFTFDHVLDGVIAACRRDTAKLWLIRVKNNRVREQVLFPGVDERDVWGPFPYEESIERSRARRGRRRKARGPAENGSANVIALPSKRTTRRASGR